MDKNCTYNLRALKRERDLKTEGKGDVKISKGESKRDVKTISKGESKEDLRASGELNGNKGDGKDKSEVDKKTKEKEERVEEKKEEKLEETEEKVEKEEAEEKDQNNEEEIENVKETKRDTEARKDELVVMKEQEELGTAMAYCNIKCCIL